MSFVQSIQISQRNNSFLRVYSKMLKKNSEQIWNQLIKVFHNEHGKDYWKLISQLPIFHMSLNQTVIGKSTYHNWYYSHIILQKNSNFNVHMLPLVLMIVLHINYISLSPFWASKYALKIRTSPQHPHPTMLMWLFTVFRIKTNFKIFS